MKSIFSFLIVWFLTQDLFATTAIKQLVSGDDHTCALFVSGKVKCFGANRSGQLGLGNTSPRGTSNGDMGDNLPFVDLGSGLEVVDISAGSGFTCAVFSNGRMKCWGDNTIGQLGLGDQKSRGLKPGEMGNALPYVDLGSNSKIKNIDIGIHHSCALFENGRMKCWGSNQYGQLGLGDRVRRGAEPGAMGDNLPFVDLGTNDRIQKIDIGLLSTCALFETGKIKCFGLNETGQLGLGNADHRGENPEQMGTNLPYVDLGQNIFVKSLALGFQHSCALTSTMNVKCWGDNVYGELGLEDTTQRGKSSQAMGDNLPFVNLGFDQKVIEIKSYYRSTCALFVNNHCCPV
ncbi:MAG: RCC1 domain-containing protein [Bdellovibrionales bacterium]